MPSNPTFLHGNPVRDFGPVQNLEVEQEEEEPTEEDALVGFGGLSRGGGLGFGGLTFGGLECGGRGFGGLAFGGLGFGGLGFGGLFIFMPAGKYATGGKFAGCGGAGGRGPRTASQSLSAGWGPGGTGSHRSGEGDL